MFVSVNPCIRTCLCVLYICYIATPYTQCGIPSPSGLPPVIHKCSEDRNGGHRFVKMYVTPFTLVTDPKIVKEMAFNKLQLCGKI